MTRHAALTLLLDTDVVLWWMAGKRDRIGKKVASMPEGPAERIVISAVTVWEVAIKRRLGKLDAPPDLLQQLERAGVELLPITHDMESFALATGDDDMNDYEVEVVW